MRCSRSIVSLLRHAFAATVVAVGAFALAGPAAGAGQQGPTTTTVSMPIEGWADFLDETRTHVLDSVYLSGDVHLVVQVWGSGSNNVQQVNIMANLDGVSGTSPTTGQRYRAVGASSVNLQNPVMTSVGDLFTAFPEQIFTFRLHAVDPEPARLNGSPISYAASAYTSSTPQTPVPFVCKALYGANGQLVTTWMECPVTLDCEDVADPHCGHVYLLRPSGCSAVQDESGRVEAWSCPGCTSYPGLSDAPIHLGSCGQAAQRSYPLYFEIPVFERFECRGDGCATN